MTVTTVAPAKTRSPLLLVGAALAIVYVVWGSTYLAIRIMVEEMPPLVSAGVRFLTAGLLVGGALAVICHRVLSGERPAGRTVAGVAMGFGGMVVVVTANGLGSAFPVWTMAVILVAGLSWAFGSWYQPRIGLPRDPFVVAVYEMLIGGGALTIIGLASGEHFDPVAYSARSWAAWGYLVLFGSVLAFSAHIWLLQSTATSLAATYAYVNPLVAVCLGWLILAEPVTVPTLGGGMIVVLAVAVVVRSEFQR